MGEAAFVGMGSNLGDRWEYLRAGLADLAAVDGLSLERASSVYETDPVGPIAQPRFLNAVVCLRAELPPDKLLHQLQRIEARHGRQRELRWGPRTLDLDLLLYGRLQLHTDELVLPHPHLCERAFVLVPLCEIAPDLTHPVTGAPLCGLLQSLSGTTGVQRLGAMGP
ncbi:MAG: 2-amino-4-hydroxy-6-hydroxymethyldihydropteridine diphosphokinase [Candidatus Latescibacterota bacterium]